MPVDNSSPSKKPEIESTTLIEIGKLSYDTSKPLGEDGQGKVYIGFQGGEEGRKVAIKLILIKKLSPDYKERLKTINLQGKADDNGHVINLYDYEEDDTNIYLAMRLCTGTLKQEDNMQEEQKIKFMKECLMGIRDLHRRNIIHRDIKPSNILIYQSIDQKKALLGDLDLAKIENSVKDDASNSLVERGMGSNNWMAPEMRSEGRITRKVDMFSYGCVLYWTLTGRYIGEPMYNHNELNGHIANQLVEKLIEKNPEKRPEARHILGTSTKRTSNKGHPLFWTEDEKLDFFCYLSDDLSNLHKGLLDQACEELEVNSPVGKFKGLQKRMNKNCNGKCNKQTSKCGIVYYIFEGEYKTFSAKTQHPTLQILRTLRNFAHHLSDKGFDPHVRAEVTDGNPQWKGKLLEYFEKNFKGLLSHVYHTMGKYRQYLAKSKVYFLAGHDCGFF